MQMCIYIYIYIYIYIFVFTNRGLTTQLLKNAYGPMLSEINPTLVKITSHVANISMIIV
jgi:hypothetical protein